MRIAFVIRNDSMTGGIRVVAIYAERLARARPSNIRRCFRETTRDVSCKDAVVDRGTRLRHDNGDDPRSHARVGFMAFYPGPGLGGHCIPIDPFYLTWKAREYGISTRSIKLAGEINANMPAYVVKELAIALDLQQKKWP